MRGMGCSSSWDKDLSIARREMSGEQCLPFRLQITKIASKVKPLKIKRRLCMVPRWYSMVYLAEIYLTAQRFSLLCFRPYTEESWLWVRYMWQKATDRGNKLWDTVQPPCRAICLGLTSLLLIIDEWKAGSGPRVGLWGRIISINILISLLLFNTVFRYEVLFKKRHSHLDENQCGCLLFPA